MIEVKDEILEGEPLYRFVDKDGNVILDNIKLEMKTPVIQAGTPLNKVLFDSIKEDDENIVNLIDKTNVYAEALISEESISTNKNVLNVSNGLDLTTENRIVRFTPKDAIADTVNVIPILSSDNQYGYKITGTFPNSNYTGGNYYQAFDGNTSTYAYGSVNSGASYWYLTIETPIKIKPKQITITVYNIENDDTVVSASEDGVTWDTFHKFTERGPISVTKTIDINTEKFYKYFRFSGTPYTIKESMRVYNFQITSGERYLFNESLQTMLNGKDVIQNTDEPQIYLDGKYEAVYDGEKYILRNNVETEIKAIKSAIVALGGSV